MENDASSAKRGSRDLTEEMKANVKSTFAMFEIERKGFMDVAQLKVAMRSLGFEPRKEEVKKLLKEVDPKSTGKVEENDFVRVMGQKLVEKGATEEIMKAFRLFDDDTTGKISFANLKRVAQELGEVISDTELKEMIEEADKDGDGEVSESEFRTIMRKTCLY
ncbi:unnamed protein product [Notodromas monacha]|uniref:EF-hand domain-containing protein n=1 Tax=Notodromas monacha TaxID=399045 RepID=A0A7R9BPP4_9CRUS|nr:unnamed protein product [Notodromas monacha]CAG0917876.1 unnamed protein product [Notodromas monacha]